MLCGETAMRRRSVFVTAPGQPIPATNTSATIVNQSQVYLENFSTINPVGWLLFTQGKGTWFVPNLAFGFNAGALSGQAVAPGAYYISPTLKSPAMATRRRALCPASSASVSIRNSAQLLSGRPDSNLVQSLRGPNSSHPRTSMRRAIPTGSLRATREQFRRFDLIDGGHRFSGERSAGCGIAAHGVEDRRHGAQRRCQSIRNHSAFSQDTFQALKVSSRGQVLSEQIGDVRGIRRHGTRAQRLAQQRNRAANIGVERSVDRTERHRLWSGRVHRRMSEASGSVVAFATSAK